MVSRVRTVNLAKVALHDVARKVAVYRVVMELVVGRDGMTTGTVVIPPSPIVAMLLSHLLLLSSSSSSHALSTHDGLHDLLRGHGMAHGILHNVPVEGKVVLVLGHARVALPQGRLAAQVLGGVKVANLRLVGNESSPNLVKELGRQIGHGHVALPVRPDKVAPVHAVQRVGLEERLNGGLDGSVHLGALGNLSHALAAQAVGHVGGQFALVLGPPVLELRDLVGRKVVGRRHDALQSDGLVGGAIDNVALSHVDELRGRHGLHGRTQVVHHLDVALSRHLLEGGHERRVPVGVKGRDGH